MSILRPSEAFTPPPPPLDFSSGVVKLFWYVSRSTLTKPCACSCSQSSDGSYSTFNFYVHTNMSDFKLFIFKVTKSCARHCLLLYWKVIFMFSLWLNQLPFCVLNDIIWIAALKSMSKSKFMHFICIRRHKIIWESRCKVKSI